MRCHFGALHEWIDSVSFIVDDVAMKRVFCVGWGVRCLKKFLRTDVESLFLMLFHDLYNKAETAVAYSRHGGYWKWIVWEGGGRQIFTEQDRLEVL